MLCGELVGREAEMGRLGERLARAADGRGGVVVLRGEAGSGKSRLVAEALSDAGASRPGEVLVLSGRAVPGDTPVAFRPLTEAFVAAFRDRPLPRDRSFTGFEGQLARLMPGWEARTPADDSAVLLGEAVVRLLVARAEGKPCVLVLEDLHWADPETLDVVDYLGDALRTEPILCIATTRHDRSLDALVDRLAGRDPDTLIRVAPLDPTGIDAMVSGCLGAPEVPAGLGEFVHQHSDGTPFMVEELLAGLVAAGTLDGSDGRWVITGPLNPAVPASLQDSIRRRLAELAPDDRRVLGAAALLGRHFDWEMLPAIAEVDGRFAVDALRAAVAEQLIETEGDGFRFRHALTREAVLADLLPPERRALALRAWPAIERANPGLPGASCQLAADLAEAAGDGSAAAERLVECARRALAAGALATSELTVRRGRVLAPGATSAALDADELLVHVLVASGKLAEALMAGRAVVGEMEALGADASRHVDLLVALARAAVAAGDGTAAVSAVEGARRVAGHEPDPALAARIDSVAAEVALDGGDLEEAERLARGAIDGARRTGQDEVLCASLLALGRVLRPQGMSAAREWFEQASKVAERAGLARWHLRAQQELAYQALVHGGTEELVATRALGARYGAHLTVASMDLAIADLSLLGYEQAPCLRAATACVEASRRFGLATEPVAHLWLAGAHALDGDDEAMARSIDDALVRDPDHPRILADLDGRVLSTRAFVRGEFDALPGILDRMIGHVRVASAADSVYPGRATWALLHAIDDEDHGADARAEYAEAAVRIGMPMFSLLGDLIEAIALGRAGDHGGAGDLAGPAYAALTANRFGAGWVRSNGLLVASAAIRDGWGDPVLWLRESEAWFAGRGYEVLARRSRSLLGQAGAPMPRRGRGDSDVPVSLRALGVTSRETDVLKLVVEGRTTKEIATALYLSPKTVERHLTSLFARTGVANRKDLAQMGAAHLA